MGNTVSVPGVRRGARTVISALVFWSVFLNALLMAWCLVTKVDDSDVQRRDDLYQTVETNSMLVPLFRLIVRIASPPAGILPVYLHTVGRFGAAKNAERIPP